MLFNFIQISIDIKVTLATVGYNLYCVSDFTIIAIESKEVHTYVAIFYIYNLCWPIHFQSRVIPVYERPF